MGQTQTNPAIRAQTADAAPAQPEISAAAAETAKQPVFRMGELCPMCGIGILEYNGMADIECPVCHETEGPGAGCT